ncbi:MAG: D-alanyl-D-alanine carboxypeptidase [Nitrospirae bacterium]|nr:D-alanyl-D-alanine carboxypeptidase [Nitrospirota bacterium]
MILREKAKCEINSSQHVKSFLFLLFILFIPAFLSLKASEAAEISAKAAIVVESASEEILFAKNPDLKLPPASTTKVITVMVALDTLSPDELVTVSRKASETPSVPPRLREGEKVSVKNLLHFALIRSINGAAVALAEAAAGSEDAFVPLMNKKAASLGALNTQFINASGLPGKGQHTTARDLAKILKEALTYPLISGILDTKVASLEVDGKSVILTNTNYLLWADEDHLGGKTGYTRAARHCFVGASEKEDGVLIIALLGDKTRDRLWTDAEKLLAQDFEKGKIIIDAEKAAYKKVTRRKAVHRSKVKKSRTKSL